ncbi:transglycosylase SLT domain-containing protein [Pseudomonas entomophila]|uniref:transglycosylase SLT domain-containing protein n=1 Tax=Pseudomonas entomophila TaxID=312306 RepID=UPI00200F1F7F|nr:transglycosylase SLT domain-containing protein [Pseudomonas entomophila]
MRNDADATGLPKESPYRALYVAAGEAHGVSPDLLERQGFAESSWNPEALGPMTKYGQARGLAQFIPGTGKAYGLLTDSDFHDPQKAIPAQARYMADLKKRFGGSDELALAAYNMGPTALQRKLDKAGGIIENAEIPEETRGYLQKILEGKQSGWAPDGTRPLSRINFGTPSAPAESALDRISTATPVELGTDSERSSWEALMGGLWRSTFTSDHRAHNVTGWKARPDWSPTAEDVERVATAGIGEAGATFVFDHAHSGDDLDGLIEIAKENRESAAADARGGLLTSLMGGLGEMLGDPVTYGAMLLPGLGQVGRLFNPGTARVLAGAAGSGVEGAAYGALTESLRESSTGVDADYQSAILAGAVGGAALHGIAVGVKQAFGRNNPMDSFRYVEDAETSKVLEEAGVISEQPYRPGPLTERILASDAARKQAQDLGFFREGSEKRLSKSSYIKQRTAKKEGSPAVSKEQASEEYDRLNGILDMEDTLNPVARISTIGERMRSSQNSEIRKAALGLFRNDKGYKDGTSGLGRMTGEEVKRNLDNEWFDVDSTYSRHAESYIRSQRHAGLSKAELEEEFGYLVTLARESGNREGLPQAVSEAADLMGNFYDQRIGDVLTPAGRFGSGADIIENPLQWQGVRNYSPVIMDTAKIARASAKAGGDQALLETTGKALYASLKNPEVRTKAIQAFEAEMKALAEQEARKNPTWTLLEPVKAETPDGKLTEEFQKWAQQRARNQALGYVDQDMSRIKAHLYKTMDPAELPDFMKSRGLFTTDAKITLADGSEFSINKDLRSGDVRSIMHSYHKRTAGDLAMSVGLGDSGYAGFAERLSRIEQQNAKAGRSGDAVLKRQLDGDLNALKIAAKKLYGMSLGNHDESWLHHLTQSLTNLSFVAKSAYMGPMNYTEIASGLHNYGLGFFFKALPEVGQMFQRVAKGKATADDLAMLQNRLWGEEIHNVVYPSHLNSVYQVALQSSPAPFAAFKAGTAWLARWAPSAQLLGSTTNRIVKAAQEEFLAVLVRHAHGEPSKVFSAAKLKYMNVDRTKLKLILEHVKKSSTVDSKGRFTLDSGKLLEGREALSEIRRMGDIAATDVIQRPSIGDTFIWADSANPFIGAVTQYQTFSMRSVEKKFLKGANRIRNKDADEALQLVLSMGLSALGVAAFAAVRAQTIQDDDRRTEFYKNTMGYDPDTGEMDISTLAIGALKRSSYMAGPSLAWDTIGSPLGLPYAGLGRTTRDTELDTGERPKAWSSLSLAEKVGNFPAMKWATQFASIPINAANLLRNDLDEDQIRRQKEALLRNLKGTMPNDPATQGALGWLMEHGMYEP